MQVPLILSDGFSNILLKFIILEKFSIKTNEKGHCNVSLINYLDYEEESSYNLTIKLKSDTRSTKIELNTAILIINIEDINDNFPEFFNSPNIVSNKYYCSISKDVPYSTAIAQIKVNFYIKLYFL